MTNKRKRLPADKILRSLQISSFQIEIRKSKRGAVLVAAGVMGVSDFSEKSVTILSHSGRLNICGEDLSISSFENRTLEVFGRIEEVYLSYAKS